MKEKKSVFVSVSEKEDVVSPAASLWWHDERTLGGCEQDGSQGDGVAWLAGGGER